MKRLFAFSLLLIIGISSFSQESQPVTINEAVQEAVQYLTLHVEKGSTVV